MAVPCKILVKDDEVTPQAVEDFKVWLFDSADAYITEGLTDVDGEIEFMLDGDPDPGREYILRFLKSGWSVPEGPTQRILVTEPLTPPAVGLAFDVTVQSHTLPESSDPLFCRLSGYLTDASGAAVAGRGVEFHQRMGYPTAASLGFHYSGSPTVVDRKILVRDKKAITDDNGYLEVALPRGGLYDVHIHGLEHPSEIISPIVVPDAAGWKLEDVFFPYSTDVAYGDDPVALAADESVEVDLTCTMSNGLELEAAADVIGFLRFYSSDESVASVTGVIDGPKLQVVGVSAGSATIEVERVAGTWAPRLPAVADILVTPATVEVT